MKRQLVEEIQELFNPQSKLTPKQKIRKEQFVLHFPLFELIYQKKGEANFQTILSSLRLVRVDFGQIIFRGIEGRCFNFILQGVIMLFVKGRQSRDQPRLFRRLESGEYFGEKIVFGKEQLESARATSPGYLLQLSMPIFYATFSGHFKYEQLKEPIKFLQGIWVFSEVKRALLERILLSSETRRCSRNSILAKQGDQVQHMLVIMEGEVTLYFTRQGRSNPLCVLGKGEVCGLEELVNQKPYCHTFICTSDHAQVLKVERETALDIVERDIPAEIMRKRSKVATQLRQKSLDPISLKICSQKQLQILYPKKAQTHRRRYRSQGGKPRQQITIKPLNQLFDREVQLKESQLRRYRLQQIQENQKALYCTNRISTYANNSSTYDKEIIARYLDRKQRRFRDILRKERQMIEKKVLLVPELRVQRSSAVRNHKRKLKNSRQNLYSTLEIYD